ncbi:MAG TPA: endonuclease/exonuclease/phosphatase family protein [Mycobacteriales bacterium]|nr:endonuclease/exonuclease/phosphatase family protein [Mycobacteriales bacterium]
MRLVSFNLLHGRCLTDGVVNADRVAAAVADLGADVIGLQEVDRAQPRSNRLDLAAIAADALGASDFRFEPALVGTPGGHWRTAADGEHGPSGLPMYGVALLSRLPVRSWHCLRLGRAPMRSPVLAPGTHRPVWVADEPRVGLAAVLQTPGGAMTVATTHLSFVPGWNVVQLRQLVAFLRALPAPRILIGDLNLPGKVPSAVSRWRSLARVPTYPRVQPRVQLDHALGDGGPPPVVAARAVPMPLSDHRALVLDLADRQRALR